MGLPKIKKIHCATCKQFKTLDSFYRNRSRKSGRHAQCKQCMNTAHRKRDHAKRRKTTNPMRNWPTDKVSIKDRIMRGLMRQPSGCLEWQRATSHGYGVLRINGRNELVHRLSFEIQNGKQIKDGLFVLHKCDNPRCAEPTHLFLGTQADNMQDMKTKGRHWRHRGQTKNT